MSHFPVGRRREPFESGDHLADGVRVERRQIVMVSLAAAAALSAAWPRSVLTERLAPSADSAWDALVDHAIPMAEKMVRSLAPNEEEYLVRLSGLIEPLAIVPPAQFDPGAPVAPAWSLMKLPLVVMQFRLAPQAAIPYHDHRDYNGVLRVVEGDVRVRNFEIQGPDKHPPRESTFQIRETRNALLTAGQISTLSRTRDNIHDVRAGKKGSRLIDFFTFFSKDGESVYLQVDEQPRDPDRKIYDASWLQH